MGEVDGGLPVANDRFVNCETPKNHLESCVNGVRFTWKEVGRLFLSATSDRHGRYDQRNEDELDNTSFRRSMENISGADGACLNHSPA
jgi:hypothetical protein